MKKLTLLGALVLMAGAANAQYSVDPSTSVVLGKGPVTYLGAIALDAKAVDQFKAQGANVQEYGPDGVERNLWVWENTFEAGSTTIPGVDDQMDGYTSLVVTNVGWSGAGWNILGTADTPTPGTGVNTTAWNDNTRFHLAYYSPATLCPSVAIIIADGKAKVGGADVVSAPAKVSLGAAFVDNGTQMPSVAPAPTDDWQGLDISFGDLKKFWPAFAPLATEGWGGNIMSLLAGGVAGQSIALDAVYFYNQGESGVEGVEADAASWTVTKSTVNLNGGANGIELYNLAGQLVKSTNGCVLGLNGLAQGVYVARSAKSAVKVVVK